MASLVVNCPDHGTESSAHVVVTTGHGLGWRYSFPCCEITILVATKGPQSPAKPDAPIVPAQRDQRFF